MPRHLLKAINLKTEYAKALERAKAGSTRARISDGDGLVIEVRPTGSASWQLIYTMPGKTKRPFTIGAYPGVTLETARKVADLVRNKIAEGIDPNEEKRAKRAPAESPVEVGETIQQIGDEYIAECKRQGFSVVYLRDITRAFDVDLYPYLGHRVAKGVTAEDLDGVLRRIEARGAHEHRRRFFGWVRRMFGAANIRPNPCLVVDNKDYKKPAKTGGRPGVTTPRELAQVVRSIHHFGGSLVSRAALMIHARTFVRPTELQFADWSSVGKSHWTIKVILSEGIYDHLVPLTAKTAELFEELRPLHKQFIVPGVRYGQRISEATLNAALHALGWKDVHCTHGFRKSASTLLNEMGWDENWIERQLSHQLRDKVKGAYNKAKYLPQRERMMQCWSDYIDALLDPKSGAEELLPHVWRRQWEGLNKEAA